MAGVDRPILIVGERGTGKELAAARLHYLSSRWREPLVALNCAALAPSLIESELFGYEAGAFTGAVRRRIGRFEAANGGTLFLDEIGNIPLEVQAKILRVVEYQSFERVGGANPIQVDVRIIGATNADLPELADAGRFQRDLLDRLAFEVLIVPPLRERRGDILLLARHFAARMSHEIGRTDLSTFSESAEALLEHYAWPGNVRELKNVVERAVYRSDTAMITEIDFNPFVPLNQIEPQAREEPKTRAPVDVQGKDSGSLPKQIADLERRLIRGAMENSRFNQRKAADILGLSYHQFRGLYRKHGGRRIWLDPADGGAESSDRLNPEAST